MREWLSQLQPDDHQAYWLSDSVRGDNDYYFYILREAKKWWIVQVKPVATNGHSIMPQELDKLVRECGPFKTLTAAKAAWRVMFGN